MTKRFLGGQLYGKLTQEELEKINKSVDLVGDIAILKIPPELDKEKTVVADAIMNVNKNVKTVLNQVTPVLGEYRLRNFEWVAGEKKTSTIYREYGCNFKVNLSKTYFSPRLSYERMRISKLVKKNEVVINMFAGIGCFSLIIAKQSRVSKVFSIDINPRAFELMRENIALNKVEDKVEAILGDARETVETSLQDLANRVLMPLPERAYENLDVACKALRSEAGFIHYYDFVHAKKGEDATGKVAEKVSKKLASYGKCFELVFSRVVRTVGPNWHQVVLDINLH